mgnify:CR=1 FL=1
MLCCCMAVQKMELSAGYRLTTNNRMEVLAVIKGLEALKEPCRVNLYSDSKYVVDAIEKGLGCEMAAERLDAEQKRRRLQMLTSGSGCILLLAKASGDLPLGEGACGQPRQ